MTRLFAGTPFDIPPECEICGQKESECQCTPETKAAFEKKRQIAANRLAPSEQTAQVRTEVRKGKRRVTVVSGLTAKANDLSELLSKLQATCGTGGTVKANEDLVELQGDHMENVRQALRGLGYRVK
ncbi:translation initiation factor Sui1 [Roseimaritima multifibrata]|uniref:Translation initiation factor Sui1 n=1 Tax=Roseimaritima multifibrata TaxID=1930274 RepID=A0A517MFF4_9BACT|nr:translation initiation factor [Roseimaritima multifibrata]QDS93614.1 translation initiation factor Sui1 [Roseimaritima multifibrata]